MFGYAWMCFDMLGYAWICLDMFGYAWICLDMLGQAWICLDMLGYVWIFEKAWLFRSLLGVTFDYYKSSDSRGGKHIAVWIILIAPLPLQGLYGMFMDGKCVENR